MIFYLFNLSEGSNEKGLNIGIKRYVMFKADLVVC